MNRKKIYNEQNTNLHRPGIEPGSLAWKANILTTIPTMLLDSRTRTSDLGNYSPPLYQLSYIETCIVFNLYLLSHFQIRK